MGINTINSTPVQQVQIPAYSSILSGDLITNLESGYAVKTSTALSISQSNKATAATSAITAGTTVVGGSAYGNTQQIYSSICTALDNGNYVVLYSGDNSTANQNLNISIRSQNTPSVANIVLSDSTVNFFRAQKINSTSFLVAYQSSTVLKFAVFSNSGTQTSSLITVATLANAGAWYWNVGCLTNGNIVFTWGDGSNNAQYSVYSSTGSVVLSATTIEASANPAYNTVLPQSGGGFIVYYYRQAATANWKFARYNASGVIQGTLTTLPGTSGQYASGTNAYDTNLAIELENGNVVFQKPNSSAFPFLYVYNSTGTLVTSNIDFTGSSSAYGYQNVPVALCAISGGFAGVGAGATTARYLNTYDLSGNSVRYRTTIGGTLGVVAVNSSTSTGIQIFNLGAAGFAVFEQPSGNVGCAANFPILLYTFDTTGASRGANVTVATAQINTYSQMSATMLIDGTMALMWRTQGSGIFTSTYQLQRSSTIGVSQTSASVNQQALVYTQGNYVVNQTFLAGGTFDSRTATVPGTKGTVVGSYVILFGIS